MLPLYLNTKHLPCPHGKGLQRWLKLAGIFLFAIYLVPSVVHAQPNITRVEYYIDIDPGFGNATNLSITPSPNIQNATIVINPTTLTAGVHRLFVRARDANGSWSLTNLWLFYKPYPNPPTPPPAPVLAKMSKLEYYFDNDPGYGNGIPVALDTTLSNFANYVVPVNITGLATGSHTFWVRGLDKNGKWSMMNDLTFTVPAVIAAPAVVVNSITDTVHCAADSFNISFHKTGTYNGGNVFNVELSNNAGSFTSPTNIGSYTGTGNAIVKVKLPAHVAEGSTYKVRVNGTNPAVTGVATAITLTIHDRPTTQTITGATEAVMGASYTYSVPASPGSTWTWLAPDATITQDNDSAVIVFNDQGVKTIRVIETNEFGCVGDTSTITVMVMGALPVTNISFTVAGEKDKVVLQWTTAAEFNSKDFKIQRSLDGINFETIGTVQAAGNSNSLRRYRFHDLQSVSLKGKMVFFRIIQTDINGQLFYTDVRKLKIANGINNFTLVYNPVKNEALLNYESVEKDEVLIRVADYVGRIVIVKQLKVVAGINQIKLQTGSLAKGIYGIELLSRNNHGIVRMMKE